MLSVARPLVAFALAQVVTSGPQVTAFHSLIDDSDQPYALYLPKNLDSAKKYPLVIALHGAGSSHQLMLRRLFGKGNRLGEGDFEASRAFPPFPDVAFIVAAPLARGTMGYQGIPEQDVYDVLDDVKRRYPVDEDRVYLTGVSMGGGGALWLGLTRPDVWAAIAAVCPAPPEEAAELASNAGGLPVSLFHGDQDPLVKVETSRRWYRSLIAAGADVRYTEYPGVRHNAWDKAYENATIFNWFAQYRRNQFPNRVHFLTRAYKYSSAYWVKIDSLTPGELASIDARFTSANQVEVKIEGLDGFTLTPAGHPMYSTSQPVRVVVNGIPLLVKAGGALSFTNANGKWVAARHVTPVGAKRAGLEGPISGALVARHIYVYGTGASSGDTELAQRREIAAAAAHWPAQGNPLRLSFRAIADKAVTPEILADSNLVLFGNKLNNLLIARFSAELPMELHPGAAGYGLLFVAPAGGHAVVVNSGLPWWTGAANMTRPEFRYVSPPVGVLHGMGDFVLFKGSLENVVAQGRFDRNWKLSASAAKAIQSTGVVLIR